MFKNMAMTALEHARRLIEENPRTKTSAALSDLVISLESGTPLLVERLYAVKLADFDLDTELIRERRLARYFGSKGKLLDPAVQARNLGVH